MPHDQPAPCPSRRTFFRGIGAALGAAALPPTVAPSAPAGEKPKAFNKDPGLTQKARDLVRDAIVIDAYNCGAYAKHRQEPPGWFTERGKAQVDLIKALEGGVTAAGFDLGDGVRAPHAIAGGHDQLLPALKAGKDWRDLPWPPPDGKPYAQVDVQRSALANALMGLQNFLREIELASDRVLLVTRGSQIREAKKQRKVAVILHGNTVGMFEDSIEVLQLWYRLGLRMMILARAGRNLVCDGYLEARTQSKLTTFGVRVVQEMNRLGMVIDGSHMSDASFYDLLDVSRQPVICSHSNSRAICPHPRNLTDDQVKALARRGGVVGLTFVPAFIDLDAGRTTGHPPSSPLFQKWVDHCDRFVQLVGPDHVGLGSDFDGGGTLLADMSQFTDVPEALLRRGYNEKDVRKILGESMLRVFEQVLRG